MLALVYKTEYRMISIANVTSLVILIVISMDTPPCYLFYLNVCFIAKDQIFSAVNVCIVSDIIENSERYILYIYMYDKAVALVVRIAERTNPVST